MKKFVFLLLFVFVCVLSYGQEIMVLKTSGKVVIGDINIISTPGDYNLYVQNGVLTERVKVALKNANDWSDDAFNLTPSLEQVKSSIENKSHLHNMPSAAELVKEGYELKSMDAKLLEQIEWLWQYTIKLADENKALKEELSAIKEQIEQKK